MQLEDVRELMQAEKETGPVIPFRPKRPGNVVVWSHVYIADGLELHIQPEQARLCPENLKELVKRINIVFTNIRGDRITDYLVTLEEKRSARASKQQ